MSKKVLFFTNVFPHYREAFWEKLVSSIDFEIHFYYSKKARFGIKSSNVNSNRFKEFFTRFHEIKNFYFKNFLIFQSKVIFKTLFSSYNVIVFTGESQVISTWISTIIAKARNKKVVYWGHGLYGGEKGIKGLIRDIFNCLPNHHLVYGSRAKQIMIQKGYNENRIDVIYNSLNYESQKEFFEKNRNIKKSELFYFFKTSSLKTIIFSGRLIVSKNIDLLIEVLKDINKENVKFNLLIVGEGKQKESLMKSSLQGIIDGWIHFYGACYNEEILSELFMASDVCISPGNVGLLAVQSFSYGVPVITNSNFEKQMPEVEIIENGVTGSFFEFNNKDSLKETILSFDFNLDYSNKCRRLIDQYYNPSYQYSVFKNVILNLYES